MDILPEIKQKQSDFVHLSSHHVKLHILTSCPFLHAIISWSTSCFWNNPIDVLGRTLDITSFAVNTILGVDLKSNTFANFYRHILIDT